MTNTSAAIVLVTMGRPVVPLLHHPASAGRVRAIDLYALPETDLSAVRGLLIGMHCDQHALLQMQARLEAFVRQGGRIALCGMVAYPFLTGLSCFTPLRNYRLDDLMVINLAPHPVWAGIALHDLTYRRGVAGFYGRGHHTPPLDAQVINGLGPSRLPLDFVYRLEQGDVLVHSGNDLWGYIEDPTSAHRLAPQVLDWMERDE